jgi:RNA polymerase sigma-70 factor (ECF subfamily)
MPADAPQASSSETDWEGLVNQIRAGEEIGMETLYRMFARGIRFYLRSQLGSQELDEKVHDTFLTVVQAIRRGDLRDPQRLMGFVRPVVRRQVAAKIEVAVWRRSDATTSAAVRLSEPTVLDPENAAMRRELIERVLDEMSGREREVLNRFYLRGQDQEQICADMNLSETQFDC